MNLFRWSLRLILQGEWPGLAQIVKTRLGVTLQRCSRVAVLQPLCRTLLPLVSDPWGQTTKTIFSDSEVQDEEGLLEFMQELTLCLYRIYCHVVLNIMSFHQRVFCLLL